MGNLLGIILILLPSFVFWVIMLKYCYEEDEKISRKAHEKACFFY
jgi:hypothetical protein